MSSEEGEVDREAEIRAVVRDELEAQDSLTSGTVPISRRGLLQGGAALGIGGLAGSVLGGGGSGRVAAQTAAGQVGTDSDRVDVFGNVVDAASVSTEDVTTGERPVFDIRHYGAEEGADSTDAIQGAIDAAANAGYGAKVFIPHGNWPVSDTIVVGDDRLIIEGVGRGSRIDADDITDGAVFRSLSDDRGGGSAEFLKIRDLHVNSGNVSSGTVGIHVERFTRGCAINGCRLFGVDKGIQIDHSWSFEVHGNHVVNGESVGIEANPDLNNASFRKNHVRDVSTGYDFGNLTNCEVVGNSAEVGVDVGYYIGARGGHVTDNYYEGPGTGFVLGRLESTDDRAFQNVTVGGNHIYINSGEKAYILGDVRDCKFDPDSLVGDSSVRFHIPTSGTVDIRYNEFHMRIGDHFEYDGQTDSRGEVLSAASEWNNEVFSYGYTHLTGDRSKEIAYSGGERLWEHGKLSTDFDTYYFRAHGVSEYRFENVPVEVREGTLRLGTGGAELHIENGDIIAVDEDGNETTLT